MAQFIGNILIRGRIECLTGLHIGGSKDKMEIGGVDSPVVRDPVTHRQPYIPGSSLKGKMRMLLEYATGNVEMGDEKQDKKRGDVHNCTRPDCPVCRIFGSSAAEERRCGPTRLLVRDAYPDEATVERWDKYGFGASVCRDEVGEFSESYYVGGKSAIFGACSEGVKVRSGNGLQYV